MTREQIINNLSKFQSPQPSQWREQAQWRLDNEDWLECSAQIALNILNRMEETNVNEAQLANTLGISINELMKILSGNENLSLKTICQIEKALNIKL